MFIPFRLTPLSRLAGNAQMFCWCKGTAKISSVQEGTFWCHSYQKVGIVKPSAFRNSYFNSD